MLTAALIVFSATIGPAADPAPEELQSQVRKLVRQLGSAELAQRDAAEKALIELGPAALDVLERVPPQTSAEVKIRLARVRQTLYRLAVQQATQATKVTLSADEKPLTDVLAAIQKQTGNRIVDKRQEFGQQVTNPKISVDFANTPYWEALDKVLDRAGLTTYNYSGDKNTTAIIARQTGLAPRYGSAVYSGVFRFEPVQLEAIRDLRNPANRVLQLYLEVAWEPRLLPIAMTQPLANISLTDEDGGPIAVDRRVGTLVAEVNSAVAATEMEIPLELPPRSVEKIATLRGELAVLVPGRVESFTFDSLASAKDVQQKKADATVLLQDVRKNGDIHEVRMVLQFDKAAGALESHRGWVLGNEAFLVDAQGQRIEAAGYETTRQTVNEVGFAYKFVIEGGLDGYEFVYKTPAAIVEKSIPYELKDIPLP